MTLDDQHDARRTIARLAEETVPRLIERLARSELGELEVREDGWRIRLRRAEGVNGAADKPVSETRDRGRHAAAAGAAGHSERQGGRSPSPHRGEQDRGRVTSPAVGYFIAREGISVGSRVGKGDVIGQVDVLGVAQEVVASVEGTIGRFEVEPGQAIEYGQPVARIEIAGSRGSSGSGATGTDEAGEPVIGQLVEA